MARQLVALGDFVEANLDFFLQFARPEQPNTFNPPFDGTAMGAAAENRPVIGSFQLAPDEALVVEVEPPRGLYWSYSLGNPWWETIDYGRHQSSLNGHQAVVDDDGVLRVVIAHDDPGVANWLDTAGHSEGPIILRCVRTETAPVPTTRVVPFADVAAALPPDTRRVTVDERAAVIDARAARGEPALRPVTLDPDELEADAREQTGLSDFGDGYHREGLERLVASMNDEADLTETGELMQRGRLGAHLVARLQVEATYREHPEIEEQQVEGPVFVIGLPRTGTTALSQLVAADPQFRSLRLWESGSPVPPPETATEHTDPRIAATEAGLALMNEAFPAHADHVPLRGDDRERVPGPHGHELPDRALRRFRTRAVVHGVGDRLRHAGNVRVPPARAAPSAMALPTAAVAPEDAGAHVRVGRVARRVSERAVPLEPSRPGHGDRVGVQPHPLHAQLEQRP